MLDSGTFWSYKRASNINDNVKKLMELTERTPIKGDTTEARG